ncbi:hypothetical protein WK53_08665 [Burkholderia ubonensis]|uniref:Transposase n=1 Tax=Burkholderia ubonensis TaxID=101571 RepID=A0AAW3N884_9BURK|nr:hypothetical protein WK53_08665 [Burkholderia ubonensis]
MRGILPQPSITELRDEAVKLALTEGVWISEASRRLSIPIKTLANCVRAAQAGKLKDVDRHQKPLTEMEAELGAGQTRTLIEAVAHIAG